MYKTSNANFPLIYGHEYKTLKLNSNRNKNIVTDLNNIHINCIYGEVLWFKIQTI
jgi:hypothetical protein